MEKARTHCIQEERENEWKRKRGTLETKADLGPGTVSRVWVIATRDANEVLIIPEILHLLKTSVRIGASDHPGHEVLSCFSAVTGPTPSLVKYAQGLVRVVGVARANAIVPHRGHVDVVCNAPCRSAYQEQGYQMWLEVHSNQMMKSVLAFWSICP